MRKHLLMAAFVALGLTAAPNQVSAQGLLKKLGKGLEKVNKKMENANNKIDEFTGAATTQENGIIVMNPQRSHFDVELVGAYGISKSENFGDVELVFKVSAKDPITSIRIGGNTNFYHTQAYDNDGNIYKPHHDLISKSYDVTEGLAVRIVHNDGYQFENVRKSVESFPLIKVGFNGKTWENGEVTFKNVPVLWDVEH